MAETISLSIDVPAVAEQTSKIRVSCGLSSADVVLVSGSTAGGDDRWRVKGQGGQTTLADALAAAAALVTAEERHRLAELALDASVPPPA